MREFKHFSYYTEYSCTGSFHKSIYKTPCFYDVFNSVNNKSDIIYNVQFYKGTKFQVVMGAGSACIITKDQINYLLNALNRIFHFFYKIEEYTDNNGFEKYRVTMHIKRVPKTFHKFVLANLRCVYEFPHNLLLRDAFILKERSPFKRENIFNLLNLTLSCNFDKLHDEHLVIEGKKLCFSETIVGLKKKIRNTDYLHNIYRYISENYNNIPFSLSTDDDSIYTVRDIEYWDFGFAKRLPVYEKAYSEKRAAIRIIRKNLAL